MEFNDAATHCHASQQFTGVKRLREVVVGTRGQTSHDLIFVCVASEQYDVGVSTLVAAYLAAEFDPSDVWHLPICDNHRRAFRREEITGLATVFREANNIFFLSKSLSDELAIEARVVRHQDLEFLCGNGHLSTAQSILDPWRE